PNCFAILRALLHSLRGAAILGIGIWVKVDGGSFIKILGAAAPQLMQIVNVGYVCIAVGGFLILMGFLGCCGAVKESRCMLMTFFTIILIIFIAEMVAAVVVLAFSSLSKVFIDFLGNVATKFLKNEYGQNNDLTAVWNTTMKELPCCGFRDFQDFNESYYYKQHSNQYPEVCCNYATPCNATKISPLIKGCFVAFEQFLNKNGKILGGVALGLCGLEVKEKRTPETPHISVSALYRVI
uniref:Tetraspanin n=1 Tax=Leptobrachium leishanense TaxID=445787 RepID=A0A8C5LMH1_9ANUR